jgi:DNA-3-methyladenine glycosylase II
MEDGEVMERFALHPRGPYALAASIRFLEGFTPAAYASAVPGHLHLAFVMEDSTGATGVCVRQAGEDVIGEVVGRSDVGAVRAQVARILSLDIDGSDFLLVGQRDPVIGSLQARYRGLRPVLFNSPYEAAAWALIGQRIRMQQAARIKARMAQTLGPEITIHGERLHAFPPPAQLATLDTFPGLTEEKMRRLRALGHAANTASLDAPRLRAMPVEDALAQLKELPGIGDFSAQLILLRGAGEPDYLPTAEPRLARAVALAYGLDHRPSAAELSRIAAAWRPYRTWATLLLRTTLEEETHESTRGTAPHSARAATERQAT